MYVVKAKTLNELFLYGPRYAWLLIKSRCHHILSFLAIVMRHLALDKTVKKGLLRHFLIALAYKAFCKTGAKLLKAHVT